MLNFTCSKCGQHRLEEVMINVTLYSEVIEVDGEVCNYGHTNTDDGEVSHYQCLDCGELVGYKIEDCVTS